MHSPAFVAPASERAGLPWSGPASPPFLCAVTIRGQGQFASESQLSVESSLWHRLSLRRAFAQEQARDNHAHGKDDLRPPEIKICGEAESIGGKADHVGSFGLTGIPIEQLRLPLQRVFVEGATGRTRTTPRQRLLGHKDEVSYGSRLGRPGQSGQTIEHAPTVRMNFSLPAKIGCVIRDRFATPIRHPRSHLARSCRSSTPTAKTPNRENIAPSVRPWHLPPHKTHSTESPR